MGPETRARAPGKGPVFIIAARGVRRADPTREKKKRRRRKSAGGSTPLQIIQIKVAPPRSHAAPYLFKAMVICVGGEL